MKTRKKKKTAKKKEPRKRRLRSTEVIGLLVLVFAVFTLVSLLSYDVHDPSWASASSSAGNVHNYGGKVGASLAEAILQVFGLGAFLIPIVLGALSVRTLLPGDRGSFWLRIGGSFLLLLILGGLFSILFQRFSWRGADIESGGVVGASLGSLLVPYLSQAGTFIFLIALLFLFILFSTELSLGKVISFFGRLLRFAFKEVRIRVTDYRKSKAREKMRRKVVDKYTQPPEAEKKREKIRKEPETKDAEAGAKGKKEEKKELKKGLRPEPILIHPPLPAQPEKLLFPEMEKKGDYHFPPFTLLDPGAPSEQIDKNELYEKKMRIEEKLREFRVEGEVKEYHPGPVITTYEFSPNPGIKVSQVANLSEDLSLALGAESVRIQRIPGRSSLGVEIPNNRREIIKLRDIIQSEKFLKSPSKLTFALGKTIHGEVYITDLSIMPHLLIAGATGTGKSVALNSLIASILYKAAPEEVKLILIDPKRLEFTLYDGIPHLLTPVINDPKKAGGVLMDAIRKMEERYHRLSFLKVRDIVQYNHQVNKILQEKKGTLTDEEKQKLKPLPYIVIIIDELAELMMVGAQEVEYCIARLAQLARAVGIHLVLATQRPSIDVITGTIKNNFACRIAFRVPSKVDSRIIIDTAGADKLLGLGDMLFMPPNYPRLIRLHCAFISIPEVTRLVKYVKEQRAPEFDEKLVKFIKAPTAQEWEDMGEKDELYDEAVRLILATGQASASWLQRKLKLGYARAARIIDQMEQEGILGPSEGSKPREILVDSQTYLGKKDREKES
ncbi:MAG: DNA translocase FtsK 4TM domain-containing protein [Candidatus Aminicenantes bacterium]|nr:DNA translocase FtsK 4TM domain-containing protein [Candidatus Aminicenantes bacterium]